jgi:hypothetical protein
MDQYLVKTIWFSKSALGGSRRKNITYVERDEADMGWPQTIADIMSGQISDVVKVICFNEAAGTCLNVSREVAEEILVRVRDEPTDMPAGSLMDFLEDQLGCQAIAEFERELEGVA